jgi:arsenate reductase/regulatory protein spx
MTKPKQARGKKAGTVAHFLYKPACATCRKARNIMKRRGYHLRFRDIWKEPLTAAELKKLIGDRDHLEFLNKRSEVYKKRKMKDAPPSRREAITLMAREPALIRRPIIVAGGRVVVGFDEQGRARL